MRLRNIPLNLFQTTIQETNSISEFLQKFNLSPKGGKYKTFHKIVKENNFNIDHYIKHKKEGQFIPLTKNDFIEKYLKKLNTSKKIRHYLLKFNILEHKCQECNLSPEWNNKVLTLQLDHIDGNPFNNELSNLRFLCPNCHSQTSTFGTKNRIKEQPSFKCIKCNLEEVKNKGRMCKKCIPSYQPKIIWPSIQDMTDMLKTKTFVSIAQDLNVSDNAVRNFCKRNNILF